MKPLPFPLSLAFSALLLLLLPGPARGLEPTKKDLAYGTERPDIQALDVYLAESEKPVPAMIYIHGGGWRAGSKDRIPGILAQGVEAGRFSVVSVEYRFTDVAVHPAQVNDCLRAVQFVRRHAGEWNIDPVRIGVTGGSAGAHLSLWVALHDDVADPDADDPVKRQSSRVACAVGFAGPTDWSLLAEIEHRHPAYRQLLGYEPGTPAEDMDADRKRGVSPISYVSPDDPPILLVHGDADDIVPIEHARRLDARLDEAGVISDLHIVEGGKHNVAGAGGEDVAEKVNAFLKTHLEVGD